MSHARLTHGTLEGYRDRGCRCKKCREVWDLYMSEYRTEIFDETKATYQEVDVPLNDNDYSERKRRY